MGNLGNIIFHLDFRSVQVKPPVPPVGIPASFDLLGGDFHSVRAKPPVPPVGIPASFA